MKRVAVFFLAFLVLLTSLLFSLPGQAQKIRIKVVSEQANIRLKPDIGSEMVWQVPEGTELEADGKEGEWFQVVVTKPDGSRLRGYVHESLVEVVEAGTVVRPPVKVPVTRVEMPPPDTRPAPATPKKTAPIDYMLTVMGGGFYLSPADLNQAAEGVTRYYLAELNSGREAELSGLHLVWTYGLDFFYPLNRQIFLGLGFDYLHGSKGSAVSFSQDGLNYKIITRPGLKDLALRLSVLYYPVDIFYIRAGVEVNLARVSYLYRLEQGDQYLEWKGRASGINVGWQEAAGIQWPVTSWLQVYAEATYRYVRVRNFEGNNFYSDSDGLQRTEEGQLYYWQVEQDDKYYPALFVRDRLPTDPGVVNPRRADINFSGLSLRAGLRLIF
ncbi:MAG: SH3 domain-containing protein [Candidatus Saccharicenans sp.]|uniref:SH3 domain-containing protein n=1 Tax=Candidatus Saccharicenans sp. TaxID=2819258 RepID=UPI004049B5A8